MVLAGLFGKTASLPLVALAAALIAAPPAANAQGLFDALFGGPVRKQPKNVEGARAAREFFRWVYANGDEQARALGYVPLPDSLVRQVETYWTTTLKY